MGKIILELSDQDLLQLGEVKIKEEVRQTLKWLKMKGLLKNISQALNSLKIDHEAEVNKIKQESWQEYKKELSLWKVSIWYILWHLLKQYYKFSISASVVKKIVKSLLEKDLIVWEELPEKLQNIINGIITEDLMVEDRLNEEVKTLLDSKTKEYERSMMDYGRVFQMVKSKLVRERGLIL